ncbi:hypothetical protein SGRIM119S_06490 [Streptomyces griseorubiginosus]
MRPGVVADDVSLVGHPGQQVLVVDRHLAAHEEHRADVVLGEGVQDVRGVAGVRAVVEGQHHGPAASGHLQHRLVAYECAVGGGLGRAVSGEGLEAVGRGLERTGRGWRAGGGEGRPDRLLVADHREHPGRAGGSCRGDSGHQGPAPGQDRRLRRRQSCEQLILRHDSSVARRSADAPQQHRCGGTNTPARPSEDAPVGHDGSSGQAPGGCVGPGLVPSVEAGCRGRRRAAAAARSRPPPRVPRSAAHAHPLWPVPPAVRTCGFR